MDLSTNGRERIHVRLLNEPVLVWRPAWAIRVSKTRYVILDQDIPDGEEWEFRPGAEVKIEVVTDERGTYKRAV